MTNSRNRCRVIPLAGHQVAFEIDGKERLRWHYGTEYPRPFFFPLIGPGGDTLTRMGHPGAPNHDHHRSVWFAHHKVSGINFWADQTDAQIRQQEWLCYQEGDAAEMAVRLGWYDGHDPKELLQQELIVSVKPAVDDNLWFEIQTTFTPTSKMLEFDKTNFGFFAVRVASEIAEYFGGGTLTNSVGQVHEKNIFGKPSEWMDYSGEIRPGNFEGITYFNHPTNLDHPVSWHVREDGWMGASPGMHKPILITKQKPLTLRYLLHVHAGKYDADATRKIATEFANLPALRVVPESKKHIMHRIERVTP